MQLLWQYDDRSFWVLRLSESKLNRPPFHGRSFPALIWNHAHKPVAPELARELVRSGCRFAVCAGFSPGAFELAVDQAFLAEFGTDEKAWGCDFTMTTAHENESPDDVAHFFVLNTNFDEHDFREYLVVHIGDSPASKAVDAAVWRYAAPTRPNKSLERSRER